MDVMLIDRLRGGGIRQIKRRYMGMTFVKNENVLGKVGEKGVR